MALLVVAEIQLVNHIQYLPQQNSILHVLIGVSKGGLNNGLSDGRVRVHLDAFHQNCPVGVLHIFSLKDGKEGVIDKVQKVIAGHGIAGFVVMGPVSPAAWFRDDGLIVLLIPLPVLFLGVIYFQEQHPGNLFNALGITVDARVIAHNVPQPLYKSR